ncbi:hypothetical protein L336_0162 [Candidatus Saccharimonas aalborgensis]|uniref:Uncharacterized protein n=1 Tax=Candidatus Saccharimonas aalborgensis TaxID=1332188 RepID=R4PVU8_9BACT|nr:hypothetical protein [Candidatus Saccharimonas aalborgensis]AGL61872.1 hypothetical protein L336_0162 [Candidatus Saccharimonas aalborgensis]QQS68400.1 MAG: hypothetical protein IPP24_05355 [Candidatus Saccharibacteria bacterium]
MASKETSAGCSPSVVGSDELLDELASFLYDAYQHSRDNIGAKIELDKGQIAENEEDTK